MQSQAAALGEEGEQGHDLCSRCRLCPGQTSSRCCGRVVRGITTGWDFLLFFSPASFSAGLSHGLLQLLYLPALGVH